MEKKKTLNPLLAKTGNGKSLADNMMEVTGEPIGRTGENNPLKRKPSLPCGNNAEEWDGFIEGIEKYTGLKEQGVAVWIPKAVKKQLEQIRANAKTNIPIRALAAAMKVAFIKKHGDELGTL